MNQLMNQLYVAVDFVSDMRNEAGLWYDVKIGSSKNAVKRIDGMKTSRPNVCLLWNHPATRAEEGRLHHAIKFGCDSWLLHHVKEWYWMHEDAFTITDDGQPTLMPEIKLAFISLLGLITSGEMPRERV